MTKGAVYSNFESKEDLFLALLSETGAGAEWYAPHDVSQVGWLATASERSPSGVTPPGSSPPDARSHCSSS